jgi:hypothetical protein
MASEITMGYLTATAGSDLSAKQYYVLRVTGSNTVDVATAATQVAVGVLQNNPASGEAATYSMEGCRVKVYAGAAIAAGASLTANASGQAITGGTGDQCFAIALTAASAGGEYVEAVQISHVAA